MAGKFFPRDFFYGKAPTVNTAMLGSQVVSREQL